MSRVLNDHPDVSENMRIRVLEAIEELGYEPNLLAAGLRTGSTRTVGFIVADLRNPLYASIVTAAQRELARKGYAVVITTSDSEADRDKEMARVLRLRQVDALIVSLADETHRGVIEELNRFDGPVVLLDRHVPDLGAASSVETDHGDGMRQATEHLVEHGHERIALVTGPPQVRPTAQRVEAFRAVHRTYGLTSPQRFIRSGSFQPNFGEVATRDLLSMPCPPTALIAGGNLLLTGVLRAFRRLGLQPGQDLSLISCDDVPLSELHTPSITVINRDISELGRSGARLALEHLSDPDTPPRKIVLPTSLVLRESTRPI